MLRESLVVGSIALGLLLVSVICMLCLGGGESPRARPCATASRPIRTDAAAGAAAACPSGLWTTVRACGADGACGPAATEVQQCVTAPSVVQTVSCGAAAPPCTCHASDLRALLGANATSVTFCGGICDAAQVGQQCVLGCVAGTAPTSDGGFATVTCLADGTWAWNKDHAFSCAPPQIRCPDVTPSAFLTTLVAPGVRCQGATPGDRCVIACHVGNAPAGDVSVATCRADGTWDHALACVPQDCGAGTGCIQYAG